MYLASMGQDEKKVPRRKKHRNSKLGCATCKRRRVKCVEDLPACTNCVKHRVRCEYLDYSEKQIEEFRKMKRAQAADADDDDRRAEDGELRMEALHLVDGDVDHDLAPALFHDLASVDVSHPHSQGELTPSELARLSPSSGPASLGDLVLPDVHMALADHLVPVDLHSHAGGGVLDVLNFRHNAITQNFDNLLTTDDRPIIYPVYLIHNTPDFDVAAGPLKEAPAGAFGSARDVFGLPLAAPAAHMPMDGAIAVVLPHALAGATLARRRFTVSPRTTPDYQDLLLQTTIALGPEIAQGRALLAQIRHLYHVWIGSFICKAHGLGVMFSCLINLTTNYLITNVFSAHGELFDTLVLLTKLRNTLVVHLIQHYATVIKGLRLLLNRNTDPEMGSSVLYILLLMSIYDPEATVHSTKCFRDGMFSVLSYSLHLATRTGVQPPRLIPIHLHLMTNVARTVYLPAYHEGFLAEFETMLARFGTILDLTDSLPKSMHLRRKYNDLQLFAHDTFHTYVPSVNKNLSDINFQEEIFFLMFRRWALLQPARFVVLHALADPLERVLNLFVRLFRKAVFAVVPQVRFFFLRDFDSPLMLDVFANNNDVDVFYELDGPLQYMAPDAYVLAHPQVRALAAYAIRLITFLQIRLTILYRNLVYHENVKLLYPIKNVMEWRNSMLDVKKTREEFHERIGLLEYSISSFMQTYITSLHFPQIVDPTTPSSRLETPRPPDIDADEGEVDLLSLQPTGLLAKDVLPPVDP